MTDLILVHNKTARSFGPSYALTKTEGEGKKTREVVTGQKFLNIKPGINKLERFEWNKVKDTPLVQTLLENEELAELDDKTELSAMAVTRAAQIVRSTLDKEILRGWQRNEKRKPVADAIKAQLVLLDGSKPDKDKGAGDDTSPDTVSTQSPLQPGGVDVSKPRGRKAS